jgi:hypothetical protein
MFTVDDGGDINTLGSVDAAAADADGPWMSAKAAAVTAKIITRMLLLRYDG